MRWKRGFRRTGRARRRIEGGLPSRRRAAPCADARPAPYERPKEERGETVTRWQVRARGPENIDIAARRVTAARPSPTGRRRAPRAPGRRRGHAAPGVIVRGTRGVGAARDRSAIAVAADRAEARGGRCRRPAAAARAGPRPRATATTRSTVVDRQSSTREMIHAAAKPEGPSETLSGVRRGELRCTARGAQWPSIAHRGRPCTRLRPRRRRGPRPLEKIIMKPQQMLLCSSLGELQ